MQLPPSLLFVAQSAPIRVFGIRLVARRCAPRG